MEGLALERPPLPITSLHRQVRLFAEAIGEPLPSYWIVYDLVRSMPAALDTLAHKATKAYGERFDLVHRREATHANAVWQRDHAQLDILLLRPDGPPAQPWLTIVIDDSPATILLPGPLPLPRDPPDLAEKVVSLREIVRARNLRRWELQTTIKSRQSVVDALLDFRRGQVSEEAHAKPDASARPAVPALKRYRNE